MKFAKDITKIKRVTFFETQCSDQSWLQVRSVSELIVCVNSLLYLIVELVEIRQQGFAGFIKYMQVITYRQCPRPWLLLVEQNINSECLANVLCFVLHVTTLFVVLVQFSATFGMKTSVFTRTMYSIGRWCHCMMSVRLSVRQSGVTLVYADHVSSATSNFMTTIN